MQDAGGGRVLRGVAGRGSSYIWTGEKILYTWARLLICCPSPSPLPFFLFRAGHIVRIGCRVGFQAGRDAGGRLLSAGSRRAAGQRAGRQAGQAVAGRLSVCLCPLSLSFSVLGVVLALACWVLGVLCWAGLAWAAGRGWGMPVLGGLSRPPGGVLSVILHKVLLENTA